MEDKTFIVNHYCTRDEETLFHVTSDALTFRVTRISDPNSILNAGKRKANQLLQNNIATLDRCGWPQHLQ